MAVLNDLTLTLVSADHLPDIRKLGEMKVYARIEFTGQRHEVHKTPTDLEGKTSPRWDFEVSFQNLGEAEINQSGIQITLWCKRSIGANKAIGHVTIPVKMLLDTGVSGDCTFPVVGTSEGRLHILYNFSERIEEDDGELEAEPAAAASSSSSSSLKKKAKKMGKKVLAEGAKAVTTGVTYGMVMAGIEGDESDDQD